MTFYIAPIVEGQTEAGCIERLLQRVWNELFAAPIPLRVLEPSRGKRDALINPKYPDLARKLEEAYAKLGQRLRRDPSARGLLLVLLDAEGDCPRTLAPELLARARSVRGNADIACVLARRMLENWIVAGASSLAGVNGLPDPLPARDRFEDCGGAAWLEAQLRNRNPARKYKKTADAKEFVSKMALQECRDNAPSFDKLCRELQARLPRQDAPSEAAKPPTSPAAGGGASP